MKKFLPTGELDPSSYHKVLDPAEARLKLARAVLAEIPRQVSHNCSLPQHLLFGFVVYLPLWSPSAKSLFGGSNVVPIIPNYTGRRGIIKKKCIPDFPPSTYTSSGL